MGLKKFGDDDEIRLHELRRFISRGMGNIFEEPYRT